MDFTFAGLVFTFLQWSGHIRHIRSWLFKFITYLLLTKNMTTFANHKIQLSLASLLMLSLLGCNFSSSSSPSPTKPNKPEGVGHELDVAIPSRVYPLPVVEHAEHNAQDPERFMIEHNPVATILNGFNRIWHLGLSGWQNDANGDGPESFKEQKIIDADAWRHNMSYVLQVTEQRTPEQAIESYSDDRRSKNYSVIDGFGPLTHAYLAGSGAYVDLDVPRVSDVLENENFFAVHNDGGDYSGDIHADLGAVVQLVNDFRQNSPASANGSKYIFSSPRPWRMTASGEVDYLGTYLHHCEQQDGSTEQRIYDWYQSPVKVLPGLRCAARHHGNDPLTDEGENRRKDGGYPSGHTNAGYLAAMAYAYAFPQRYAELLTRGSQLGENRIITGMHSPLDVMGARIHFQTIAAYALGQDHIYQNAQAAYQQAQAYFAGQAQAEGLELYDYAHRWVEHELGFIDGDNIIVEVGNNNRYADRQANKRVYRERLSYGFSQNLQLAGQAPEIPEGAERLLETRQPYLSDMQRRAVLYTTALDSGYPILDDSKGWGRLDLVTAADGYGAFIGDVTVNMDARKGGFHARDWWYNDISGAGKLTKQGSGSLHLAGNNSYRGGSLIEQGRIVAESAHALGSGDVYLLDGGLSVALSEPLNIAGHFTQEGGILKLVPGADFTPVNVVKQLFIEGGELHLDLSALDLNAGDAIPLIEAGQRYGEFTRVDAGDIELRLEYRNQAVIAHIL